MVAMEHPTAQMAGDVVAYADALDFTGKNSRQRKTRLIRMDVREHDVVTANLLTGMGYTLGVHGMVVGDYGWDLREGSFLYDKYRSVVVERKTLADLRDVGRLKRQLKKMTDAYHGYPFPIVLIEFAFDTDRKRRWPEESILNAELSMQLGGVHVTRCEGNDVAGRLDSLWKWSQKRTHQLAGGE